MVEHVEDGGEAAGHAQRFRGQPALSMVEADLFCHGCGYNLRTQAVRRDPNTRLLLVCCPECGGFSYVASGAGFAGRWGKRVLAVALWVWIGGLLACFAVAVLLQAGLLHEILYSYTDYEYSGRIATMPDADELSQLYFFFAVCALTEYFGLSLFVGAVSHWRKYSYLLFAIALLVCGCSFTMADWYIEEPDLFSWVFLCTAWLCAGELAIALAAIFTGRMVVRRLIVLLVPPPSLPAFAHLWLVDGLEPPKPKHHLGS